MCFEITKSIKSSKEQISPQSNAIEFTEPCLNTDYIKSIDNTGIEYYLQGLDRNIKLMFNDKDMGKMMKNKDNMYTSLLAGYNAAKNSNVDIYI